MNVDNNDLDNDTVSNAEKTALEGKKISCKSLFNKFGWEYFKNCF